MNDWISAHLYYHDDVTPVLRKWIYPLMATPAMANLTSRWFFIRYWEGGPHVRLRVQPRAPELVQIIQHQIRTSAATFVAAWPARDSLTNEGYRQQIGMLARFEHGTMNVPPLVANHTLQFVPYVSETSVYGGERAMPAIEEFFWASSVFTGHVLHNAELSVMRVALTTDLLAIGMGVPHLPELIPVIEQWLEVWLCSFGPEADHARMVIVAQADRNAAGARQTGMPVLAYLQRPDRVALDPLTATWVQAVAALYAHLRHLHQSGHLHITADRVFHNDDPVLAIVLRCLHMHHNRMGIRIADEAYIAQLLLVVLRAAFPASVSTVHEKVNV